MLSEKIMRIIVYIEKENKSIKITTKFVLFNYKFNILIFNHLMWSHTLKLLSWKKSLILYW